tara:strand:+ start:3154 stop:3381 length:228 start_codon:yes stop_codon:yes gene_type:complete
LQFFQKRKVEHGRKAAPIQVICDLNIEVPMSTILVGQLNIEAGRSEKAFMSNYGIALLITMPKFGGGTRKELIVA